MNETLSERIARQRAQRIALKGIPTTAADLKPLRDARERIRKIEHRARQDRMLREAARVLVRQVERDTGTTAPETVQKFIRGE